MNLQNVRLTSLDAMRGFTIAAMIMVNYPGTWDYAYPPLLHAAWNGFTPTDIIFPFFLFIVGISIALAYTKRLESGTPKKEIYRKIIIRSLKIFGVGMLLNLIPDFNFTDLRWTGVLHRIAIVFFVCAFLFLNTGWKTQAWVGGMILVVYWLAMTLIPTPGIGKVMMEPGANLAAWFDSQFLPGKKWQGTWDPEGLLSTFPAIVTGITGLLAGKLFLSEYSPNEKSNYLMVFGLFSVAFGYFWGLDFPINKNLWSSSFVLVTSGLAAWVMGAIYFLVDILDKKKGTAVGVIFGANAISVYVLADILSLIFYQLNLGGQSLNQHFVTGSTSAGLQPELASLLYALLFVAVNFIPAYILFKKNIFIKL
ncbi:MAG: heparan-alpha-glucosaminide N-acetyltransferase domain-containing protein [Anditalea sp.]